MEVMLFSCGSQPMMEHGLIAIVFLPPGIGDELEHDSTVAYSTCKFGKAVDSLERSIQDGVFQEIARPSDAVLRRVIAAGHTAAGMPRGAKRFLAQF